MYHGPAEDKAVQYFTRAGENANNVCIQCIFNYALHMHAYTYSHVCMYECMYVCMYVCMYESFCCIYGEEYLEEIPFCIFFPYFLDKLCSQYDNIRKGFYKSHCSMLDLFKHTEVSLFIRLWMQK